MGDAKKTIIGMRAITTIKSGYGKKKTMKKKCVVINKYTKKTKILTKLKG